MALTKVIGDGLGGTNDLTVDTDTLIVDSTNDKVGINVASPNNYYSKELVVGIPDNGGITILNSDTTHAGCIMFADGTGTSAYRGQIVYDHNDDSIGMWTAATNAMRIDSTGAMTKPNQPAFMAKPNSNQTNVGTNTVIEFANEIFDQNADFDTSTHTFTAPITGRYLICLNMRMDQVDRDMNYCRFKVETSNNTYDANIIDPGVFASDPAYWTFTTTVLADMDASDTAVVKWNYSSGSNTADTSTDSTFSIFLAC